MEFNDLLGKEGIDPKTVLVLRHRPQQREIRKVLPWLAAERPDIYNAYQQQQSLSVEPAMVKPDFVASFIGHEAGKALFIGLYRRGQWRPLTHNEYWRVPANIEMRAFGMLGPVRESILWFDLAPTAFYQDWKGRLIVDWPPPEAALSQWRGIYFIFDENDSKGYVGSAYGTENIPGRWLSYAAGGHGGNKELRKRDPTHFRFSIPQRVSPDMEPAEIIWLEWVGKTGYIPANSG